MINGAVIVVVVLLGAVIAIALREMVRAARGQ